MLSLFIRSMRSILSVWTYCLLLFPLNVRGGPILKASSTSTDSILKTLSDLGKPFPSISSESQDQWDIFMVMDFHVANSNFKSMHAQPGKFKMFRDFYKLDCIKPSKEWFYPAGSCVEIVANLDAPTIALDSHSEAISMTMIGISGSITLMLKAGSSFTNHSVPVRSTVFRTEVGLQMTLLDVQQTIMYINASNAQLKFEINDKGSPINPVIKEFAEVEMTQAMKAVTETRTYPFVMYNTDSSKVDVALVPTSFRIQPFKQKDRSLAAIFIMTEGRTEPEQMHIEEMNYLPDGNNVFMLLSNRLMVERVIAPLLPANFHCKVIQRKSPKGKFYGIQGNFDTGLTVKASFKAHDEPCWAHYVDPPIEKEVVLGPYKMNGFDGNPSSELLFTNLAQSFRFAWASSGSAGPYGCIEGKTGYADASLNYQKGVTFGVSGGNLISSTRGATNTNNIPPRDGSGWDSFWNTSGYNAGKAAAVLRNTQYAIEQVLNFPSFLGTLNVLKDEKVLFGNFHSFSLSGAHSVYDMVLFANVVFE